MTNAEAIRVLKADYCGNRIVCELHPGQCNREDCEIWLAIEALKEAKNQNEELNNSNDLISRAAAIDAMMRLEKEDDELYGCSIPEGFDGKRAKEELEKLPSAQPYPCDVCAHKDCGDMRIYCPAERRTDE